jgi:hypothetical protein
MLAPDADSAGPGNHAVAACGYAPISSVMRGHRRRRIAKGDRSWTAGRIDQARTQAAPNCANVPALATWDMYRA